MLKLSEQVWVVIPVYNHGTTIADVASACRRITPNILVVDDGSTDCDVAAKLAGLEVNIISHPQNMGKGAALLSAIAWLEQHDAATMVTIDADGQHSPEDISNFMPVIAANPTAVIVGCRDFSDKVPNSSKFGRKFANFWFKLETGKDCDDCQSGFRAYPLKYISQIKCCCRHYNWETEILTRAAWAGLDIINIPVHCYYPPQQQRISHFRPFKDNFRISLIHAHLVALRLLPFNVHKKIVPTKHEWSILRPLELLRGLINENCSPQGLGASAAVGTFLAVIPIPGFHTVAILYVAIRWNLNKILAVLIQNLFMPPFTPFLCIEIGYFLAHGSFLRDFGAEPWFWQAPERLKDWLFGSLILAPLFAAINGIIVYLIAEKIAYAKSKS